MYRLFYTNSKGVEIELTDMTDCLINSVSGLGATQATFTTTETPKKDGASILTMKREKRNIIVNVDLFGTWNNQLIRQRMYNIFGQKGKGTIRYTDDTLDVITDAYCESLEPVIWSRTPSVQISFICPSAYFKTVQPVGTDVYQVTPLLNFPVEFVSEGIPFGTVAEIANFNMSNGGQIDAPCIIEISINGNVTNPLINNTTSNKYFGLNASFTQGQKIIINSEIGKKSVKRINTDNTETDLFYAIRNGSEWIDMVTGDNLLLVSADAGGENLVAKFIYNLYYWGVD